MAKMKTDKYKLLEILMQSDGQITLKDMRRGIKELHLPKDEEALLLNGKYREW